MKIRSLLLLVTFALLNIAAPAASQSLPPAPQNFVLDQPGWLSSVEERQLIAMLEQFQRETSNQIVVAIFDSLGDEDLADYSQRIAEHWGVGDREKQNGVLIAVFAAERQVSIEVGYGLEPVITDLIASNIYRNTIVPAFRDQRYGAGLTSAAQQLMAASRGEFEGAGQPRQAQSRRRSNGFPFWLLPLILISVFGGRRGRSRYLGPLIIASALSGGRGHGGGFGGGGFGGGGGFSGGGGSFGGGGARGGW